MKKFLLSAIAIGFLVVGIGISYLYTAFPNVPPAQGITIEGTEAQIARGKYLAEHVTLCMDCHSERDWSKFSGPITPGTYGKGGDRFDETMGFPGTFYAKNITPHNLGDWTDGEIYRAITTGVSRNGRALFPVMPYLSYGKMDPEDVKSIIAYLRTIKPIAYDAPESSPNFPMNIIIRTIPKPAKPMKKPDINADPIEKGKYLITIAACKDCHTQKDKGEYIKGMELAGGFEFEMPFGTVRSANLTPDMETGLGSWSKKKFVNRFKQHNVPVDSLQKVTDADFNTIMPWKMYSGMTQSDIEAIYAYLKTIPAVKNGVTKFTPRTKEL